MKYLNHLLPVQLKDKVDIAWGPIATNGDRSILSDEQQKKYYALGSSTRRQEFLAVQTIIDKLAASMGLDSDLFTVQKKSSGKPAAKYNGRPYHISIAHTHQKVLCAISSNHPFGVDIEPTDRPVNFNLRNRIMAPDERTFLENVSTLQIWTIKEALIKLHGKKLGANLIECAIIRSNKNIFDAEIGHKLKAKVYSFKHKNYWLAIAW